jgi:predicted HAD superfamily Cof-like phosphohydrolase
MAASNFDDVVDFHNKFGISPGIPAPHLPPRDIFEFRMKFFREELQELEDAYNAGDVMKYFDAHLDLAYITFGSAHLAGMPWQLGWDLVQRANMSKVRAASADESLTATGRGHSLDVVKPQDWVSPDVALHALIIAKQYGASDATAAAVIKNIPVGR